MAITWAQRLKRVFQLDVSQCERCGGKVKIIGRSCASCARGISASMHGTSIEDPTTIHRILEHLERHARGPPVQSPATRQH